MFRSVSQGSGARAISDILTTTERGAGSAVTESHFSAGELWVGTDDGGLWHTPDGGATWIDLWALNTNPNEVPEEADEPEAEEGVPAEEIAEEQITEVSEEAVIEEELIPEETAEVVTAEVVTAEVVTAEVVTAEEAPTPIADESLNGDWVCFAVGSGNRGAYR